MSYFIDYKNIKKTISSSNDHIEFDSIDIHTFIFKSTSYPLLPGNQTPSCDQHSKKFNADKPEYLDIGNIQNSVNKTDFDVNENREFEYKIFIPKHSKKSNEVTIMLHGFNEKDWDKYLLWAKAVADKTQTIVILFPIAFHMNRAPVSWSDKRKMFALSENRKHKFPNIIHSSLSNVAISMRLHAMPQRFIWSGLQTYYDVIQLIELLKKGEIPVIDKDFSFNIFSYSIGSLLAEIMKLSNYNNYFEHTKVAMFCGGAVFNRISPVSKFILDSEANVALYSYLIEHINSHLQTDDRLRHYIKDQHVEGRVFYSMLDYKVMREYREELFRKYEHQFYAVSLKKDYVVPSYEIVNTVQGASRDINIPVDILDFDYKYTHENPFPVNESNAQQIDIGFHKVFDKISDFLINK